jgi:hypothetical protein
MIKQSVSLALGLTLCSFSHGFNSEEHKLITDRGVQNLIISDTLKNTLPVGISTDGVAGGDYLEFLKDAKNLAVGFDSNDVDEYDPYQEHVQDNCYWTSFGQSDFNKYIHIPYLAQVPVTQLTIATKMADTPLPFTLGELSALYGDYRRTSYCSAAGQCYLSNTDTANITFSRGNVFNTDYYCPFDMNSDTYLRYIGSGVVPPYGSFGNTLSNTANPNEYYEAAWWGDEMLRVANVNDWHFSNAAVAWYVGAHRMALYYVELAQTDANYWVNALHHEANALHSLVDLFAFGHVVTHRGESSHGMIKNKSLENHEAYVWMENIINMGGGQRATNGKVNLDSNLPAINDIATNPRNDYMASDRGTWLFWANKEMQLHKDHNDKGARVKNLRGDMFNVSGDGDLDSLSTEDQLVISEAVQASVQSLMNAYEALQLNQGDTVQTIGAAGSDLFTALTYLPMYIESDPDNYFSGRFARYAKAIDEISGSHILNDDWEDCAIPYLYGDNNSPTTQSGKCTDF